MLNKKAGIFGGCTEKGLIEKHDFDKIKIKSVESKRAFLSKEELQRLRNLYATGNLSQRHKNILHLFLFTCYTGLRFQDLKNLRFEELQGDFIVLKMHKTQRTVDIPLIEEARKMLPKEAIKTGLVFKVCTNQVFNRYLKEIAGIAGIEKNISYHCVRCNKTYNYL